MGLSILIPVYNYEVSSLVKSLAEQLKKTGKQGEIIILDDCSDSYYISKNKVTSEISYVSFYRNEKNEGRMITRQRLSKLARFEYLLFLDCDSTLIKDDFLDIYFDLIDKGVVFASGGRIYCAEHPSCEFMLHWKYGKSRERVKDGLSDGCVAFISNNFMIKSEFFKKLPTDVQLPGYGHEDTLWGIQFQHFGIQSLYINNPVFHSSLEKVDTFLKKTDNALTNLLLLSEHIDAKVLSRHVRIFRWYRRLVKCRLGKLFLFVEKPFHNLFYRNLTSCRPVLLFFDIYRLAVLIRKGFHRSGT